MSGFQHRDKFFYVVPKLFPVWPYNSRLAISVSLDDHNSKGTWRNNSVWRWKIKDTIYEIDREKAIELGRKFVFSGSTCGMPNLIPMEEFRQIKEKCLIKLAPKANKKPVNQEVIGELKLF